VRADEARPRRDRVCARIFLVDRSAALVKAWSGAFHDFEVVTVHEADFFSCPADAMVSPANSFGIMDGGLDLEIRHRLGFEVQKRVQNLIVERFHGELPVGSAVVTRTEHERWPYLVAAPTMRVPGNVARTLNPYLAFRAALLAIHDFNAQAGEHVIQSVLCPGLGTGIGGVDAARCAVQMRMALKHVSEPARIPSFERIYAVHRALESA
jgi:O-acetyl-ADP-ribose deacetylase (regulator of RNase III)